MFYRNGSIIRQLILLRLLYGGGSGGTITTVTGISPLLLANAIAKPIKSLTQYGKCVQASTPTPSAPVDIVCNNGVVGMVDDELPSGYTRLSYIESDGTSGSSGSNGYVDTGILINSIDTDVEIDFQLTDTYAPSPRMAWGYMGTPSSLPRWGFGAYSSKWLGSPNATASAGEVDTDRHVAVMRVYNGGSNSAFYNGTLDGETLYNANNLGNVSIFEDNDRWPVYLFARNNNNTASNFVPCKIFRFKVYKAGALTHDLVPCKDGNGVLGFYDLVTATFSGASGTLIAGAADYSHSHIVAVGTPEVLTVRGENMADMAESNLDIGYYINNSGDRIASEFNFYSLSLIAVKPSTAYTMHLSGLLNYFNVVEYAADKAFIKRTLWGTATVKAGDTITFTTGETTAFIRFGSNPDGQTVTYDKISALTWMLSEGSAASPYKPYSAQTASVEDLYSAGDITDEHDIISGAVTHKVGIKVLDGSEEWIDGSNGYITEAVQDQDGGTYTPVCTHFRGTNTAPQKNSGTLRVYRTSGGTGRMYFAPNMTTYPTKEDFAAWLASQYANGTPVIVIYPLAEETTEQTTPHSLNSYEGTTVVDAKTNVDPVELEVEYVASVA